MPANAAIYLPIAPVSLTSVFPDATSNANLLRRRPTSHSIALNGDKVTFNVMPEDELEKHLAGFLRYIASLDEDTQRKADASMVVRMSKCVLALNTAQEFSENHAIWEALFKIASVFDGYIFVHDSLVLPNGGVIIGALGRDT